MYLPLSLFFLAAFGNCANAQLFHRQIEFYFTSTDSDVIHLNENNLDLIDPTLPVVFLAHGFLENQGAFYYSAIPEAYHKQGAYNVITVDWGAYSVNLYFLGSSQDVSLIGNEIGELVVLLNTQYGVPLSAVHVVGHSLGSHVAGYCGKYVIKTTGQKIGRISGLDPAGPNFASWLSSILGTPSQRLDAGDADIVDCVYTNMGALGANTMICGHNFIANGGNAQPGCPFDNDPVTPALPALCDHQRSIAYFLNSISNLNFRGYSCNYLFAGFGWVPYWCSQTNAVYGQHMDLVNTPKGTYFFETSADPPYALGFSYPGFM